MLPQDYSNIIILTVCKLKKILNSQGGLFINLIFCKNSSGDSASALMSQSEKTGMRHLTDSV